MPSHPKKTRAHPKLEVRAFAPLPLPGSKFRIALFCDGLMGAACIGSDPTSVRGAKACSIRYLRQVIKLVRALPDTPHQEPLDPK